MTDPAPVAGLLLTGGSSRRMGRDKATLPLPGGGTWSSAVAARLEAVAGPALEVGPGVSGLPSVPDPVPGEGPLAAVATGAAELHRRGHHGPALVVACDMPLVGTGILRLLAGWPGDHCVVPVTGGVPQPLCARLSPRALATADELVAGGARSMRSLLGAVGVAYLDEDVWLRAAGERELADADTPEEAARLGLEAVPR